MNKYRLKKGVVPHMVFEKCIMKFDFDLEPFYNKGTREITIDDKNYYDVVKIFIEFLLPLELVEENE